MRGSGEARAPHDQQRTEQLKPKIVALLVVLSTFAVALGACGGSSSDQASSAGPSRAAYITAADKRCAQANRRQLAALRGYYSKHKGEVGSKVYEEALVVNVGLPPIEAELDELEELTPPADDAERVEVVLSAIGAAITATRNDPTTVAQQAATTTFSQAEKKARAFGFKVCGQL